VFSALMTAETSNADKQLISVYCSARKVATVGNWHDSELENKMVKFLIFA